jgi:tetratricopeptide (TPR) repeat protein
VGTCLAPGAAVPTISLCMIVRDEEAFLAGCLASARGAVDEMIVVDTGSQDATKRIAHDAGAKVFDFAWCDDFAAARNASLRHATGDWVLVLDADEQLARGSALVLREAVEGARFDCGLLRLHNAPSLDMRPDDVLMWGKQRSETSRVPRLLRNTDGLAFVDPVHETATPWLRRRGSRFAALEAHIIHYGATDQVVSTKAKGERNVRLLRARLARDRTDVVAYAYLTTQLMAVGQVAEATEAADLGWEQVAGVAIDIAPAIQCLATGRVRLLLAAGRVPEARETLRTARLREGESTDLMFLDGLVSEAEASAVGGDRARRGLESARESYRDCIGTVSGHLAASFISGASSWLGLTHLGIVELLLGHPAEALGAFEQALATSPTATEPRLGLAEATLDLGEAGRALAYLESLLASPPVQPGAEVGEAKDRTPPDAWTLAAVAAHRLGFANNARLFKRRAVALLGNGFVAPHRRLRLRDLHTGDAGT